MAKKTRDKTTNGDPVEKTDVETGAEGTESVTAVTQDAEPDKPDGAAAEAAAPMVEPAADTVDAAPAADTGDTAPERSDTVSEGADSPANDSDTVFAEADRPADADGEIAARDAADEIPLAQDGDDVASAEADDMLSSQDSSAPPPAAAKPEVIRETVVERKGGFGAMLLGGAVAAVLGFGAAQFTDVRLPFLPEPAPDPFQQEARDALASQSGQIETLGARIDSTEAAVGGIDLAPLTASIEAATAETAGLRDALAALDGRLSEIDARLVTLEKAPVVEAVGPEAIAAYEREFEALRNEITRQRQEIEALAANAVAAESSAALKAELARARAALAEMTVAMQAGESFAAPLSVLSESGVEVPETLATSAGEGVPTLAELMDGFPEAARAALASARTSDGEKSLGDFLKGALGARSVTPRDGDSTDAVLSRAEAALRSGDTGGALAEIATLPEAGQAAMAAWVAQAQARQAADDALAGIARQLNEE
ncbi:COG4223 family protein [Thetidibacter halocola]|uniref:Mitochondrial inner membrane protein n=1 Tax=Thetidibacter halocola TaxID=2827239 RepID=A0A8J8B695_9RHOB|nr:hypothetical protein [Thetidibacter halocola]MBS0123781.1 hypothetical protein [Thetidibacter halocola]